MIRRTAQFLRNIRSYSCLPRIARTAHRADRVVLPAHDPGIERAIDEALAWLCLAQDNRVTRDGGVARHFSLISGWGSSYPETTGYIVSTLLDCAWRRKDVILRERVSRMLDWLVSIQLSNGAFQGGTVDAVPTVPVAFNTGQILIGLARGVAEFGDAYRTPMQRAADWLVNIQDADGASSFSTVGEKAYDVHAAWGLLERHVLEPRAPYSEAAMANVRWALSRQRRNGWFDDCCLTDQSQPLRHTLGYTLRGLIEAYRFSNEPTLLVASRCTADGLLSAMRRDGFLPGRIDSRWRGTVDWACLTGTAQVAWSWLNLFRELGEPRYRTAASLANRFARQTMHTMGPSGVRGGVKGSFPIWGSYGGNPWTEVQANAPVGASREAGKQVFSEACHGVPGPGEGCRLGDGELEPQGRLVRVSRSAARSSAVTERRTSHRGEPERACGAAWASAEA